MRMKPLQCALGFLGLTVVTVHGHVDLASECTIRAWARTPDFTPNAIIQGDARVKISAECPTIDNVSLGLRFKERSFVKALRSQDITRLNQARLSNLDDFSNTSAWPLPFSNQSAKEAYNELLRDKDLWIIREEERVVFETSQPFYVETVNHGVLRDATQDFAILVPSTNFPPSLDISGTALPLEMQILEVEWVYEYFVQTSFSNGTKKDISAGYTAFQPLHDPASSVHRSRTAIVDFNYGAGKTFAEDIHTANYSMEISSGSGLTFFAGKPNQLIDAVITRTGLARTFSAPLNVSVCVMPEFSPKWAVEYHMSDAHFNLGTALSALRTAFDGDDGASRRRRLPLCLRQRTAVVMPNSGWEEIQANEIVKTSSARFSIPIELRDTHITDFETYYQTLANILTVTLEVPHVVDSDVDPDDPFRERDADYGGAQLFEDDEEAWVPWERHAPWMKHIYSGRVPIVVHPGTECTSSLRCLASATAFGQAILSDDTRCERPSLTHYLDEGARAPIFVDRSALHSLLAEDPMERALRAPVLEPIVSSPPDGEERVQRYYIGNPRWPIYVGKTWAKKLVFSITINDFI